MGKFYVYIAILSILLLQSCIEKKIPNVDLKNAIDTKILKLKNEIKSDSAKLELCSLIPLKWDSLVVVTGYATPQLLDGFNFKNPGVLKQMVNQTPENSYTLLYVRSNSIVGYSYFEHSLVDFNMLSTQRHQGFTVMQEKECANLMIRKYQAGGRLNFRFEKLKK